MKKTKNNLPVLIILLVVAAAGFLLISDFNKNAVSAEIDSPEEEHTPNDWQFRQRAYPSGSIDSKAYFSALSFRKDKSAEKKSLLRNGQNMTPWEFGGPTNIGGRITDIEMAGSNPTAIFVGAASGGIFKSVDDGTTWLPIFDDQMNLSIGDMAIAPSNESIIYVGTGEANAGGGSLAYDGNGVYRSNDGGDSWIHLGLDSIGSVGKVVINSKDPDNCFVGAMGYLFENNNDRGVYRTSDGGNSWENVLFINDSTGVIDMAIHPANTDTIYAATWERVRRVDRRSYGGPSSGIYRSIDGGDSWQELTNGLPASSGRIGIAISESNPEILYAIYAADPSGNIQGLYKSIDDGNTWSSISSSGISSVPFMWWFGKIFVDPSNADVVYVPGFNTHKSTNGGNSWGSIFSGAHVDQHALAFHPQNNEIVILGNDGGAYMSQNGGNNYTKLNGLPITQFYTCEIDYSVPERLYGGTQDNGTNRTLTGNTNDWENIYGGDGFRSLVDPVDNNYVYAESQYGNLGRSTNGGNSFTSATNGIASGDRNNWNTPVALNPIDPSILYFGTNRLYKSNNRAGFWSAISPDLTNNFVQNNLTFGTITSIGVSPIDDQIIFVGTDDGNVQVTENDGNDWSLVSSALPNRWVTSVVADPNDSNTAYATFSGYRFGENIGHIYKTYDLGGNWLDISGDLPDIPINDLIVTPLNSDLYVATDIGVFYSLNEGLNWELLGIDLPNVVITDLTYHLSENLLVAASYGRGMYTISLDDITSVSNLDHQTILASKAFPNPFSENTTIQFNSEKRQVYKVSIFNLSGVLIKTIFNGYLAEGTHEFSFDASKLPSGVYLCKILNEEQSAQSQIKLIKL